MPAETEPVLPPLYDVEAGLTECARFRRRRDEPSVACVQLSDRLAENLARHFGPEAAETAGLALVIGAASVGGLTQLPLAALVNIVALAGQRLVVDARAAEGDTTP